MSLQDARRRLRPTIRDVAHRAAVSAATVSNVLTGRRRVTGELAARVLGAVAALGYQADGAAASLRGSARHIVGVVVPELTNPFFAGLVGAIEAQARGRGLRLLVASSAGDAIEEQRQLEALMAWRPLGVVIVPADGRFAARAVLAREQVPRVIVDRVPDDAAGLDTVGIRDREAALLATQGLIERGHHAILAVASGAWLPNMRDRMGGVAAAAAGFSIEAEILEAGVEQDAAAAVLTERLARPPRPTAIFTLGNVVTLAALKALDACGLRLALDVSLVGFDDHDWMGVVHPPISTVRQPVDELARAAVERLVARAADPSLAPYHVRHGCGLVWRRSVAVLAEPAPALPRRREPSSEDAAGALARRGAARLPTAQRGEVA